MRCHDQSPSVAASVEGKNPMCVSEEQVPLHRPRPPEGVESGLLGHQEESFNIRRSVKRNRLSDRLSAAVISPFTFYNNHYAKNNDNTYVATDNPSNCDNNHFHGNSQGRRSGSSETRPPPSSYCLVAVLCLVLSIVAIAVSSLVIYYHLSKVCPAFPLRGGKIVLSDTSLY